VTIAKINITYAQPQVDFVRSKEARQLAAVQQAEQAEKQALALRRKDEELSSKRSSRVERGASVARLVRRRGAPTRRRAEAKPRPFGQAEER
jgi:hypothetical protein